MRTVSRQGARSTGIRLTLFTLIAVGTCSIIYVLALTAHTVDRSAHGLDSLPYVITGAANSHREVMKMEAASHGTDVAATAKVRERRGLMGQQLRLSQGGLTERRHPNLDIPAFEAQLTVVDRLLAVDAERPPSPELREAIHKLEIEAKHVYDTEELHYFDHTSDAMAVSRGATRLLVAVSGVIALIGGALVIILGRTARLDLRQKTIELAGALGALETAQADRSRLLEATVRATEGERKRLAAELHDGPIQALAALCYSLDRAQRRLTRGDTEAAAAMVVTARHDLGEEVGNLRRLMSELRPPILDQGGIVDAMRDHVHALAARTGIRCRVTADIPKAEIGPEAETVLYRLMQETLTNVTRHADATTVEVVLRKVSPTDVEIVLTDDGVGFSTERADELVRNGHFGLAGMRERVEMSGGTFTLASAPGQGTRIAATLPMKRPELAAV